MLLYQVMLMYRHSRSVSVSQWLDMSLSDPYKCTCTCLNIGIVYNWSDIKRNWLQQRES